MDKKNDPVIVVIPFKFIIMGGNDMCILSYKIYMNVQTWGGIGSAVAVSLVWPGFAGCGA